MASWPPFISVFDFSSATDEWNENESWQEANTSRPLPSFWFGPICLQIYHHGAWLTFSTYLKRLNVFWRNLTGSKCSTYSFMFVFFGPIRKKATHGTQPFGPFISSSESKVLGTSCSSGNPHTTLWCIFANNFTHTTRETTFHLFIV